MTTKKNHFLIIKTCRPKKGYPPYSWNQFADTCSQFAAYLQPVCSILGKLKTNFVFCFSRQEANLQTALEAFFVDIEAWWKPTWRQNADKEANLQNTNFKSCLKPFCRHRSLVEVNLKTKYRQADKQTSSRQAAIASDCSDSFGELIRWKILLCFGFIRAH